MDPNAMAQQMVEHNVLSIANAIESQLDDKLHKLDNMGEEDLDRIREKRIAAMKKQADKKQQWLQNGHGEYREIIDEKQFFKEMKGEERMVCHFYRENWPCKVMDKHMKALSQRHIETKFCRINAEKSPFLTERLKIWMLPTLALIQSEKTTDYVVGFDELGGSDDFDTETLRNRLAHGGLINYEDDLMGMRPVQETRESTIRQSNHSRQLDSDDEDSDFGDD